MITSWKEFLTAVEEMREAQKVYFLSKSRTALLAAKKREAAVDECIEQKRAERARQSQPNLLEEARQ
jgi:hypothetical protein